MGEEGVMFCSCAEFVDVSVFFDGVTGGGCGDVTLSGFSLSGSGFLKTVKKKIKGVEMRAAIAAIIPTSVEN